MTERKFSVYYSPYHTKDIKDIDLIRRTWQERIGNSMIASIGGSTLTGIELTITDTGVSITQKGGTKIA